MPALFLLVACGETVLAQKLDRGLAAFRTGNGSVYLGWRLLSSDPSEVGFDLFRGKSVSGEFQKINAAPRVCLLEDRQYRTGVARKTMGYFYPPTLSGALFPPAQTAGALNKN